MTEKEQKNNGLDNSELSPSESTDKLYFAALVSLADTTDRISLTGNGSEKKEQLKKELGGRKFQLD